MTMFRLKYILTGWHSLKSQLRDAKAKLIMKSINREIRTLQFYESGGKQHERKSHKTYLLSTSEMSEHLVEQCNRGKKSRKENRVLKQKLVINNAEMNKRNPKAGKTKQRNKKQNSKRA